jgi:hypothetical protein
MPNIPFATFILLFIATSALLPIVRPLHIPVSRAQKEQLRHWMVCQSEVGTIHRFG